MIGVFAMSGAIFWSVGYGIDLLFHGHFGIALLAVDHPGFSDRFLLGAATIGVVAYFLASCWSLWRVFWQRRRAVAQRAQLAQAQAAGLADNAVLQSAESLPGLLKWLNAQPQLLDGVDVLRAYSSYLLACVRDARGTPPVPLPPSLTPEPGSGLRLIDLRQLLEVRLEAWAASGHPAGGGRGGIIG